MIAADGDFAHTKVKVCWYLGYSNVKICAVRAMTYEGVIIRENRNTWNSGRAGTRDAEYGQRDKLLRF